MTILPAGHSQVCEYAGPRSLIIPEDPLVCLAIPETQRKKLGGLSVTGTFIDTFRDNLLLASVEIPSIIDALAEDPPSAAYWKGIYQARQPKSYGIQQVGTGTDTIAIAFPSTSK